MSVCLAVTCHDPSGSFATGIDKYGDAVAEVFDSIAVNSTQETAQSTLGALRAASPALTRKSHGAGTMGIGAARREALALALETGTTHVAYSDLDHVVRWAGTDPDELARTMAPRAGEDLVVIGRSEAAFAREPRRLQATEGVVNHTATLLLGADVTAGETWDFMIAMRLMTRECARLIVEESTEESIANDVAWPLLAHQRGMRLAYIGVDGLAYRFRDDFGAAVDARDDDPVEWIRRLEIAARHATAMRPFTGP
jgi:hypothetical protein